MLSFGRLKASNGLPVVTVALMPDDPMLDEEARAAEAAGLVALRFLFDGLESPELSAASTAKLKKVELPVRAVFRGFMMSGKRYGDLHAGMRELGVHMIVDPGQYERAHYFPNTYSAIEKLSPRAVWVEVDDMAMVVSGPRAEANAVFEGAVRSVKGWDGCTHVCLKDFVKSAKHKRPDLLKVVVDDDLAAKACQLVSARGAAFNRGVVFKEHVAARMYDVPLDLGGQTTCPNEWRLWFCNSKMVECSPNSAAALLPRATKVPDAVIAWATEAARTIASPYATIDVSERSGEAGSGDAPECGWFCLEAGDGGVSGPALDQDVLKLWKDLRACFAAEDAREPQPQ
jgi:hypothetical protein